MPHDTNASCLVLLWSCQSNTPPNQLTADIMTGVLTRDKSMAEQKSCISIAKEVLKAVGLHQSFLRQSSPALSWLTFCV